MINKSIVNQAGVAMLTVTLLLLISATSFTFFSVKSRLMQSKMTANDIRYRQAFINAEAGLEHAINLISSRSDWATSEPGKITTSGLVTTITQNAAKYTIKVTRLNNRVLNIVSVGVGTDGNTHTVSKLLKVIQGGSAPKAAFTTAGTPFSFGATFPNGNGVSGAIGMITGGEKFSVAGAHSTGGATQIVNDPGVRGDNFYKYLNIKEKDWKTFRDDTTKVKRTDTCTGLQSTYNSAPIVPGKDGDPDVRVIWVKGNCVNAGLISGPQPLYLIVHNGNVEGSIQMNGLFYAFNNNINVADDTVLDRTKARMEIGTLNITGAAVIDYKYVTSVYGSLTFTYSESLLRKSGIGTDSDASWVPGSWRDF